MARPKKISFPPKDKIMSGIMDIIETYIFENKLVSLKEKTAELLRYSKEFNVKNLAESEIRDHFFSPFAREKTVELSSAYCERLYTLLSGMKQKFSYTHMQYVLDNFKLRYSSIDITQIKDDLLILESFKSQSFLKYLDGTQWLVFERMGDKPVKNAHWGMTVNQLYFRVNGSYLGVEMHSNYETKIKRIFKGLASVDAHKDYLFVDLLLMETSGKRVNFVLRLAETDLERQLIMIGHCTYHSKKYEHLLSKTVILLLCNSRFENYGNNNYGEIQIGDISRTDENFQRIPSEIRNFLYSRELNRMSLPSSIICDLSDLNTFHKEHREAKMNVVLRKYFCQRYFVYYAHSGKDMTVDDLIIFENPANAIIAASYTHKPDQNGLISRVWIGEPNINLSKRVISLNLSNEHDKNIKEDDPIMINFWIPDQTFPYSECECFPGVISGLEDDSTKGPVALNCLIVKADIPDFKIKDDDRIKSFFALHKAVEISPEKIKFKLNDFSKSDIDT